MGLEAFESVGFLLEVSMGTCLASCDNPGFRSNWHWLAPKNGQVSLRMKEVEQQPLEQDVGFEGSHKEDTTGSHLVIGVTGSQSPPRVF